MHWNNHYTLVGKHAFLRPSNPSWHNYDEDKLDRAFFSSMAAKRGTELHAFASEAIRLRERLEDNGKTLNLFVNESIGYRLRPEQIVYYSENCFGSADAIGYRNNTLRVSDLKTGMLPTHMEQLETYDALFCLEYMINPFDIAHELRIYQNDSVELYEPDPGKIMSIMDKIRVFDKQINRIIVENNF